ncbi:hypothetical protein [Celerinatantimonas sp. YJH-8]|uniref:hypothetical protein n=1 Tax=Celerinatantimonas sp. YJH-8 TaxID=3228714 RepID=UPI0038BFB2DE
MAITKFSVASVNSGDTQVIDLGSTILNASVAVQGYSVSYGGDDHHVKALNVKASLAGLSGSQVTVSATCTMEDDSNHKANGKVDVLVIAECDS